MEVEEEHEVLRAVRRNAERLSSSSSNDDNIDDNKDNAEAISSCLRSLRAHFCRGGGQKGKKKRDEVYLQQAQSFQSLLEIWDAHHLNNAQKVGVPLLLFIATLLRVREEEEFEEEEFDEDETTTRDDDSKKRRRSAAGASTSTSVSRLALDGLARNIIARRMRQMYSHIASGVRVRIVAAFDLFTAIIQRDDDGSLAGETFRQFDWTLQVLQKVATPRIDNNNNRKKKRKNDDDDNDDDDNGDDDQDYNITNGNNNNSDNKNTHRLSLFREERAKINQAAKASRKNIEKASNRFAFAQFYLAFLESNDESVVRSAATNRNVMYLFVRNVSKDDSETQCRFLSVLWKSVLNINVSAIQTPLKIKLATFTDVLLEQLATMAALSDGNANDENDENKKKKLDFSWDTTVVNMAVELLKEVCVNPRHGICPSQVGSGDLISRLLMKLRPAECDAHLSILSDACAAHPRLASHYVASFSSDLQPKNTEKWLSTIRMLGDLIQTSAEHSERTVGDFSTGITNENDGNDDDDDEEKIEMKARHWASSALPSTLTKTIFVKSLGHKSIVVRQASLQFLGKCLRATRKRIDLAEKNAIANQIKQRKNINTRSKIENKSVHHGLALARKREILRRARGIASADVFPEISVLIQIVMKGGTHVPEQVNTEKMDTNKKEKVESDVDKDNDNDDDDDEEEEEEEENEDEVSEFSRFSKLLALEALAERVALSPSDTVNFVDVAKILPNTREELFHNARESIAAISVARNACTASSAVSKNTLVAVFKCYAFAVMKDVEDESRDNIRLLFENIKTLFKLNLIESKTLDESFGADGSTKYSVEREAETYTHNFAQCCSAATSLDFTASLAEFLADAIVSASKRTSLDAFMDEEVSRPPRFNQPDEHDNHNTSALSPLSVIVFENALKVSRSVKKTKEEIDIVRQFAASLILPSLLRTTDFWTHAVALNKVGVHALASSKHEKKVMKTIDDILCKERQIFQSNPKNMKNFTIENVETDAVENGGTFDAHSKAKLYSLLLQNYIHEAEDFTRLLEEALRMISEMSRSGRGSLLSAVSFSVARELSRTGNDCFDGEIQSKLAAALARSIEDTELKLGAMQSTPRKCLADAFLRHSENEPLVIFAKFASEETQLDAIVKSRKEANFVLMASVANVSLNSHSVSFDGKARILALLLDVLLEEDDVENSVPILNVLAGVFEESVASNWETNIAAPYSSSAHRSLEKVLKRKRLTKSEVTSAEAGFVSSLVNSNAGEICAATFLQHCNFKDDCAVFEKAASVAIRKCADCAAIRDLVDVNMSDGKTFLNDIASLVLKQMDPTTHGNMICSARALQIALNGEDAKQKTSFEKKLSNALTDKYFSNTLSHRHTNDIMNAFNVCFDANCPQVYRVRCFQFIFKHLVALDEGGKRLSAEDKTMKRILENRLKEELEVWEKNATVDDDTINTIDAFTFAVNDENFMRSNEGDIIALVTWAQKFIFLSLKAETLKNPRRVDAMAKILAALTPKSAKKMKKRDQMREIFEELAKSCFDCVCQNEKFVQALLSRGESEEDENTSGLLDSLPQNPPSMHFVRECVDERSEKVSVSSVCISSPKGQTKNIAELKRSFAKILNASLELKYRVYIDTQQSRPDAWATKKVVEVLPLLLKGYDGSSSAFDSRIMRTIVKLDSLSGQDVLKKCGFVFGSAADKFFEGEAWNRLVFHDGDDGDSDTKMLLKERVSNAIGTSLFDCRRSAITATAFPQRQRLLFWEDTSHEEDLLLTAGNEEEIVNRLAYDPSWILPMTLRNLETESLSPRECARSGILSVAISALSSTDINFRRLARTILSTMDEIVTQIVTGKTESGEDIDLTDVMLARASFRERTQVLSILRWIRNSNDVWNNDVLTRDDEENMEAQTKYQHAEDVVWPTTATSFAAEAMWLACRPESEFFVVANKQVLKRMSIDLDRLPMFLPLVNAGDVDAKAKRTWALRQLNSSFHSLGDKDNLSSRVFRKQFVLEILSSQTCSYALADSNTRSRTMRLIKNVCENGSDSLALELVEHVSFVAFLTRRIEESVDPRASVSSSQDVSVEHRSHVAVLSLMILKGLAKAPDAFVFAGRDFVDAVRRVRSTILSRLESAGARGESNSRGGSSSIADYLVANNCFKAYLEFHATVLKRLEKRPKLNSQLATVSELYRLIVVADNNNNNEDSSSSSLVVKNTLAEILEISSFDFSCLLVGEEEDETKATPAAAVQSAALSIASSISRLAGWLNEHVSTKNEPKLASRFLCRTLLNAPDILQDALFTSLNDVQWFAKIIASDCDRRRKREVNAALALLLDFLLDEKAAEAKKVRNTIEELMCSKAQNDGNEVLLEAKLREVFFFSSSLSSSVFVRKCEKKKEASEIETTPASPASKPRKRKQAPGSGAKSRRAEKRAAKNRNSEQ